MHATMALTGGIASGKSVVSRLLERYGAVIIDSDVLAREVVAPGTKGLESIRRRFGDIVLTPDGALDRAKLGNIVFDDADALADLNAIVHPAVRARAAELQLKAPADAVVIQAIPLLVETGQADAFDVVIVVECPEQTQIRRLLRRDGFTRAQAKARLRAQASNEQRRAIADVIVSNDGTPEELEEKVAELWRLLRSGEPLPERL